MSQNPPSRTHSFSRHWSAEMTWKEARIPSCGGRSGSGRIRQHERGGPKRTATKRTSLTPMTKPNLYQLLSLKDRTRARREAMLATVIAQLLARRHHGALRFVPNNAAVRRFVERRPPPEGLGAGRWRFHPVDQKERYVPPAFVQGLARELVDGLAAVRWHPHPTRRLKSEQSELFSIVNIVLAGSKQYPDFMERITQPAFLLEIEAQTRQRCPRAELFPMPDGSVWDGLPPDPDVATWHDLDRHGRPTVIRWDTALKRWELGNVTLLPYEASSLFSYLRPTDATKIIWEEMGTGQWPCGSVALEV
jgi:hypothetical protein